MSNNIINTSKNQNNFQIVTIYKNIPLVTKGAVKKQRQDRRGHSEKGGLFKLREREGKRAQKSKPGVKPAEKDGE